MPRRPQAAPVPAAVQPPAAAAAKPSKKRGRKEAAGEDAALLIDPFTQLPSFDPYTHLREACYGPHPMCLVLADHVSDGSAEVATKSKRPRSSAGAVAAAATADHDDNDDDSSEPKMLAPVFLHFLDEHFHETVVPANFFTKAPASSQRAAHKQTKPFYLQHMVHGILDKRAFEHPVRWNCLTVYPTRCRFPTADGSLSAAVYREKAKSIGAVLMDDDGVSTPYYYRFGIRVDMDSPASVEAAAAEALDAPAAESAPKAKKRGGAIKQEQQAALQQQQDGIVPMDVDPPEPVAAPKGKRVVKKVVVKRKTRAQ